MVATRTGDTLRPHMLDAFGPMEHLFDMFEEVHDEAPDTLRISYDSYYGYPDKIVIDYKARTMDDEFTYTVNDFRPMK